jgi:flavin-dependent thymidylate synthase
MIKVKLINATTEPFNLSIASARTCYSSKGIVMPEDVKENKKLRDSIAESTLKAGHLTTRQHVQFVFAISGISRQAIWEFFHSHQFYNSEQVSQRYVEVKENNYYIPPHLKGNDLQEYLDINNIQISDYKKLIEILTPVVTDEFFKVFPARASRPAIWTNIIHKKVIEIARYVLPVSTTAYMYHTINALTLYRYARMYSTYDTRDELKQIIDQMVSEVQKIDPDFAREIPEATEERISSVENNPSNMFVFTSLVTQEYPSYLIDTNLKIAEIDVLTSALLKCDQKDIFSKLLNPVVNPYISTTINEALMSRENKILSMYHLTFAKILSHTADSQNQRHRTTLAARSGLFDTFDAMQAYRSGIKPIIPEIIKNHPRIELFYSNSLSRLYLEIDKIMKKDRVTAQYLFPNAHPIVMVETGDLLSYYHKWKLRLCYNAQDEIFRSSVTEVKLVERYIPDFTQYLRAPCYVRKLKGTTPYCPEGNRFCGVPVWDQEIDEYERLI